MSDIDSLVTDLANQLSEYSDEVAKGIAELVDTTMDNLVADTKRDAPVNQGKYKKAISSKYLKKSNTEHVKVWYVKAPAYRLAHLLNNGHAKRGGGRVAGDNHITNNVERAIESFEQGVEGVINNIGY